MSTNQVRRVDDKTIAAMQACVDHARALLESARAVRATGHHNIAYHLATLALSIRASDRRSDHESVIHRVGQILLAPQVVDVETTLLQQFLNIA